MHVLKPFRPLIGPGQWMRVLGEMNSMVDEQNRYVKGLMPRVDVLY